MRRILKLDNPRISGDDVFAFQTHLAAEGFDVSPYGVFDIATDKATRAWQTKHGLVPDGIVGPKSWAKYDDLRRSQPKPPLQRIGLLRKDSILSKARFAIRKNTRYVLGAGGYDPNAELPHDKNRGCDCTGFVAWCLGIDRRRSRNDLVEVQSDALVIEANRPNGNVVKLAKPEPGCVLVYGGVWLGKPLQSVRVRPGHAAIYEGGGMIIDCGSTPFRREGQAITRRSGAFMVDRKDCLAIALRRDVV
jgi:hypothetical protein